MRSNVFFGLLLSLIGMTLLVVGIRKRGVMLLEALGASSGGGETSGEEGTAQDSRGTQDNSGTASGGGGGKGKR